MTRDYEFERALAHDDDLDLRLARRADLQADRSRCQVLFRCEVTCDQCGKRTYKPHLTGGRELCRACCPACAARAAPWRARRSA
jgi:hypothetical protein